MYALVSVSDVILNGETGWVRHGVIDICLYDVGKETAPRSGHLIQSSVHEIQGYITGSISNMFLTEWIGFGKVGSTISLLSVLFLWPTLSR